MSLSKSMKMYLVIFADVNIFYLFFWVNRYSILKLKKVRILFVFYLDFKSRKMSLLGLLFDSGFDVVAGFDVFDIQSGFAL